MNILITNDDGIYSPGLIALAKAAARFGRIRIVAPDVEQSSMGHAITHSRPLSYRRASILEGIEAFRVNGTPADCVALGAFMWKDIDVVLSGINMGPNIGHGIWHSGTLAAAKQATLIGLRGIALSTPNAQSEPEFAGLATWVERVLGILLTDTTACLFNVNLPPEPQGMLWTRVSVRHYDGKVVPTQDPFGRELYWLTVRPIEETEEGTDRWAMQRGFVSVTPLRVDLTDHSLLEKLRASTTLDEAAAPATAAHPGDATPRQAAAQEEEASEAAAG
jgi:5'-nucleotidase